MIKLIDKYIFKQVLLATIVCLILFIVVWIAPETLFKVIKRTLEGIYTTDVAIKLLIFEIPKILSKALPVGLLLGTLFTFDTLSKNFELTVMRGVGLSFWRILAPVIILSLFFTAMCFEVFNNWIPYSTNKLNSLKQEYSTSHFVYSIRGKNETPEQSVIISDYGKNHMRKLTVLNFNEINEHNTSILKNIMIADYANKVEDGWDLKDVKKYNISKEGIFKDVENIETVKIFNPELSNKVFKLMVNSLKREREFTNEELQEYIKILKSENLTEEYNYMQNKYLQRYFHSFLCVLFAILGSLLGFSQPREQRLIGFTIAIGVIFGYYITLPFFDLLAEKSILPPFISAVIQPLCILLLIFIFKKTKDL